MRALTRPNGEQPRYARRASPGGLSAFCLRLVELTADIPRLACVLLGALLLSVTFAHRSFAIEDCPPVTARPAIAVPDKPGEMGWLLHSMKDQQGNTVQIWCLQKGNGHGGPDFAQRYISQDGKTDVWVGACLFDNGRNRPDVAFTDANKDGIPDKFTALSFENVAPPATGTDDWEFSFDPATANITVIKSKGKWVLALDPLNHDFTYRWVQTQLSKADTYKAPAKFSDLKYNGTQITLAPTVGTGVLAWAFSASARATGVTREITLEVNALGGTGTAANPFIGFDTSLMSGDTFIVTGTDITDPLVTGDAALAAYGDWMIDSYDSTYVEYVATNDVTLDPGLNIPGFEFDSPYNVIGKPWDLVSAVESSDSAGQLVPEPSSVLLMVVGLLYLGRSRYRMPSRMHAFQCPGDASRSSGTIFAQSGTA